MGYEQERKIRKLRNTRPVRNEGTQPCCTVRTYVRTLVDHLIEILSCSFLLYYCTKRLYCTMTRIIHIPLLLLGVLQVLSYSNVLGFSPAPHLFDVTTRRSQNILFSASQDNDETTYKDKKLPQQQTRRVALERTLLSVLLSAKVGIKMANAETETFESVTSRTSQLSSEVEAQGTEENSEATSPSASSAKTSSPDQRTMYDFTVPVSGKQVMVRDLVTREVNGEMKTPKAILVVNIKQDDPIARKNIPELISLGARCVAFLVNA